MPSSPLFSGSVELARNWCNNSFYKTSLSARFVVFELIRSLESLRPADLSYIIWISGAGTFYFCQIMARRSDHAAFQLFFKKCWRNAFWSLVVISCKSVRNTHPPQPGIYYIWKRGHEHWILHIFSTFYHSIMPKSCDKKKKRWCYSSNPSQLLSNRITLMFFILSSPHIHPAYCQRRRAKRFSVRRRLIQISRYLISGWKL